MKMQTAMLIAAIALSAQPQAHATTYTSDSNLANFTSGITEFADFTNCVSLWGDLGCNPVSASTIDAGKRVYGDGLNLPILASFSTATRSIRVFSNIDHLGSAYDGYQYSILGSHDGISYTLLFDALAVEGSGEPFTLGSFLGTAPDRVNNVLSGQLGPEGQTGYIADFTFGEAYSHFKFGVSTFAASSNGDQELSGVGRLESIAPVPAPGTLGLLSLGLAGLGWVRRKQHS